VPRSELPTVESREKSSADRIPDETGAERSPKTREREEKPSRPNPTRIEE